MVPESSNRDISLPSAKAFLPSKAKRKQLRHWLSQCDNNYTPHGLFRVVGLQLRSRPTLSAPAFSRDIPRTCLERLAIREDGAPRISPSRERRSGTSHGAMSRKRLITDSFQVVKKKGDRKEKKESQSPPQDVVQAESHLQDTAQPDQLEILKQFDLSWQYGPCTGITRMQRWERAKFLGLNPPTTVQDLLLTYNKDPFVIYSLWHEYAL